MNALTVSLAAFAIFAIVLLAAVLPYIQRIAEALPR